MIPQAERGGWQGHDHWFIQERTFGLGLVLWLAHTVPPNWLPLLFSSFNLSIFFNFLTNFGEIVPPPLSTLHYSMQIQLSFSFFHTRACRTLIQILFIYLFIFNFPFSSQVPSALPFLVFSSAFSPIPPSLISSVKTLDLKNLGFCFLNLLHTWFLNSTPTLPSFSFLSSIQASVFSTFPP